MVATKPTAPYFQLGQHLLHTIIGTLTALVLCANNVKAQSQPAAPPPPVEIRIVEVQGTVQVYPQGAAGWSVAQPNQILHPYDRVQAAKDSRVALRWSDQSIVSFGASTELEILPPSAADDQAGLHLIRGLISFFHRDKPGHIHLITHGAMAGVEGTEFTLAVNHADATTLSVIDGKVRFGNDQSTLLLTNGEQAVTEIGKAPMRTAGFIANNLLQWCFYYPAVIDADELQLSPAEQKALGASLAAYRCGDLLAALAAYPAKRAHPSDAEKVYHAAVLLSVGEVDETEKVLSSVTDAHERPARLRNALRQLIAAVKRQPSVLAAKPKLASELLADSYYEQSLALRDTSLLNALALARQATVVSPKCGFAWERLAELQFSFGRAKDALKSLDSSHALDPCNAQAMALTGFILAAQNQPKAASDWFDRAILTDSALGNAWLGRGLERIHAGDVLSGKADLLVAAALEPRRAELRSYLGKAYARTGDDAHAANEFAIAKQLDPNDPTAWLYSALLNQQDNQINDAIRDLEKSQELNNNRSVYRSQLLLDEDSAVRSANLAWMYQDDGMFDLSQREASRAVSTDYANYSAHLFLANSYDELRDPNWANLRYETAGDSEFLIAQLLAPTSAGIFSPTLSEQQPYGRLFDQNHLGVVNDTTYMDRGYHGFPAWSESGSAFFTSDQVSMAFESSYLADPGQRPNEQINRRVLTLDFKYQLTPQDSIFFEVNQAKLNYGDVAEYYNNADANNVEAITEDQWPNLYAGYHHEWSPGVHTLFLTSYLTSYNTIAAPNTDVGHWMYNTYDGAINAISLIPDQTIASTTPTEYSTELQQIWETPNHTTIIGAKYAWGEVGYNEIEWNGNPWSAATEFNVIPDPAHPNEINNQNFQDSFQSATIYGYHDWQVFDSIKLSAGLAYDYLQRPAVEDSTPYSTQLASKAQVSPKAGIIWNPLENTVLRAAYTRSLSGFESESSIRLEPTEVAGFNQAYRSIIPDSIGGSTSGSRQDIIALSLEQKFNTGTYVALTGEILYSRLLKNIGAYSINGNDGNATPIVQPLPESLDFREQSLIFTIDQLLGKQWSVGAKYQFSQDYLNENFWQVPTDLQSAPPFGNASIDWPFITQQNRKSVLHTVTLHANWNHPSGLFANVEANFYHQNNQGLVNSEDEGFVSPEPGDDFWQVNATVGYRFWHRRAEISGGILNIGDQNYSLDPLNYYSEMARTRTFFARFIVSF